MPTTEGRQLQQRFNAQSETGKFMQNLLISGKVNAWDYGKPSDLYEKYKDQVTDITKTQFQQNLNKMAKLFRSEFPEKKGDSRNLEDAFGGKLKMI